MLRNECQKESALLKTLAKVLGLVLGWAVLSRTRFLVRWFDFIRLKIAYNVRGFEPPMPMTNPSIPNTCTPQKIPGTTMVPSVQILSMKANGYKKALGHCFVRICYPKIHDLYARISKPQKELVSGGTSPEQCIPVESQKAQGQCIFHGISPSTETSFTMNGSNLSGCYNLGSYSPCGDVNDPRQPSGNFRRM